MMYNSLSQSLINKKVIFISEIHIKRALVLCFPKYSREMCDSVFFFFFPSSLEIAIYSIPGILIQFLVREEKAKESKIALLSLPLDLSRALFLFGKVRSYNPSWL